MITVLENPDIETASDAYAQRFAGPIGSWFLDVQAQATREMLKPYHGARVLDVGGGHGQTVPFLAAEGHHVTVLGSDATCSSRIQPWLNSGQVDFRVGDVLHLPFDDRSFDVVMAYRMLAHIQHWQLFLAELARVADQAVILDYAALYSMNYLAPWLFKWKKRIEQNTRPFSRYKKRDFVEVFTQTGYHYAGHHAQFFLPMALHRQLKNLRLSIMMEEVPRRCGLTHWLGSPVIIKFTRD